LDEAPALTIQKNFLVSAFNFDAIGSEISILNRCPQSLIFFLFRSLHQTL